MPEVAGRPTITERALRPIDRLEDLADQKAGFQQFFARCSPLATAFSQRDRRL